MPRHRATTSECRSILIAIALGVAGCGSDVQLSVNHAPGYSARNLTLSVLGVFKNGRMDAGAWGEWAPIISAAVGSNQCKPAFDENMEAAVRPLYDSFDDSTREDGITDEILDSVGKNARGDAILVIEAFGRPTPMKVGSTEAAPAPAPPPPQRSGRHGRGRSSAPAASETTPAPAPVRFEASVGVYSLKTHEIVASVHTQYDAADSEAALAGFSRQLRATLLGATCADWAWQHASSDAQSTAATR